MGSAINPKVRAAAFLERLGILKNDVHDILLQIGDDYFHQSRSIPQDLRRQLGSVIHALRSEAVEAELLCYEINFPGKSFESHTINEFVEAVESRDFERMKMASLRLDTAIAGFDGALKTIRDCQASVYH